MKLTETEAKRVILSLEKAAGDTGEYPTEQEIEEALERAQKAKG